MRICPTCKIKLGGYDYFFCTACGTLLPKDLVKRDNAFLRVADFASTSTEKPNGNSKLVLLLQPLIRSFSFKHILMIAVVLTVGIYIKSVLPSVAVEPPKITITEATNLDFSWRSGAFGVDQIMNYVPFSADIVIEGNDLNSFAREFVSIDPAYIPLSSYLNGKTKQHFVYFAQSILGNYEWALVFFPQEPLTQMPVSILEKYTWLKFWLNDPIAVITANDQLLTTIIDVKGGTAKSFVTTPLYASSNKLIPKEGKLLIFVANDQAKAYLVGLPNLSPQLQTVVKSMGTIENKYFVID